MNQDRPYNPPETEFVLAADSIDHIATMMSLAHTSLAMERNTERALVRAMDALEKLTEAMEQDPNTAGGMLGRSQFRASWGDIYDMIRRRI